MSAVTDCSFLISPFDLLVVGDQYLDFFEGDFRCGDSLATGEVSLTP